MFSGIVETTGKVLEISIQNACYHFRISHFGLFDDINIGDSIAVNGVCLTVTQFTADDFNITAVPETLRLTNLGQLKVNDAVNLERSLKSSSRIGGHYVQGHIDGVGKILELRADGSDAWLAKISIPKQLSKYVVSKGYIGLDGMSITVIEAKEDWFTVTFIPHTQAVTLVKHYQKDTLINIEVDIMGKYIEKLIGAYSHVSA